MQHTWALILALLSNVPRDHETIPSGAWNHHLPICTFLGGLTLGLVGLGNLGSGTARIGVVAFGMKVVAWSENLTQEKADAAAAGVGLPKGTYRAVSKEEVFRASDVLSVQYVLSDRSRGVVGAEDLGRMKTSSFLINTSRGPLVDEKALLETLDQGRIKGAALDVFDIEPLPLDSPWRTTQWGEHGRSQVVFTPHTGYVYEASIEAMWEMTRTQLEMIAKGDKNLPMIFK